jgi:hypothetical protein
MPSLVGAKNLLEKEKIKKEYINKLNKEYIVIKNKKLYYYKERSSYI